MAGNEPLEGRKSAHCDLQGHHAENGALTIADAVGVAHTHQGEEKTSRGILPLANDVLLGRGRPFQASSGNKRMHAIISKYKEEYVSRPRDQKRLFVEIVLDEVLQDGTRFLKRVETTDGSGYWEEVDRFTASEKVWHALRLAKDRSVGPVGSPRRESAPVQRQPPPMASSANGQMASSTHGNSTEEVIHTLAVHISESLAQATESAQHLATMLAGISQPIIPQASSLFEVTRSGRVSGHPPSLHSLTHAQPMVAHMPLNALIPAVLDYPRGAPLGVNGRRLYTSSGPQQHDNRNLASNQSHVGSQTGFSAVPNAGATGAYPHQVVMQALSGLLRPTSNHNDEPPPPPPPNRWPPL